MSLKLSLCHTAVEESIRQLPADGTWQRYSASFSPSLETRRLQPPPAAEGPGGPVSYRAADRRGYSSINQCYDECACFPHHHLSPPPPWLELASSLAKELNNVPAARIIRPNKPRQFTVPCYSATLVMLISRPRDKYNKLSCWRVSVSFLYGNMFLSMSRRKFGILW